MIESNLVFAAPLEKRPETKHIIIYHSGVVKPHTVEDIHNWHLQRKWAGIGYHYFVNKKGEIFSGRPTDTVGAHARGYNFNSVAICFEGDFNREVISDEEISEEVIELIFFLRNAYHADLLFFDELPGHKPVKGFRKDRFSNMLDQFFNWYYDESLHVYGTAGAISFGEWIVEFHHEHGIPLEDDTE